MVGGITDSAAVKACWGGRCAEGASGVRSERVERLRTGTTGRVIPKAEAARRARRSLGEKDPG